ncbi:hypothetical protein RRG08_014129 [Elysia crispata]|uniref:Uncharacterized protein n=1 Tax=Elysia crispata TaxID=231223 RepID=A0AAE1AYV4_9GAST|nr:hypothetical protein RRG08_014129 [Elysia crispata]
MLEPAGITPGQPSTSPLAAAKRIVEVVRRDKGDCHYRKILTFSTTRTGISKSFQTKISRDYPLLPECFHMGEDLGDDRASNTVRELTHHSSVHKNSYQGEEIPLISF